MCVRQTCQPLFLPLAVTNRPSAPFPSMLGKETQRNVVFAVQLSIVGYQAQGDPLFRVCRRTASSSLAMLDPFTAAAYRPAADSLFSGGIPQAAANNLREVDYFAPYMALKRKIGSQPLSAQSEGTNLRRQRTKPYPT